MSAWFSANNSPRRSGGAGGTAVRDGGGGRMGWGEMEGEGAASMAWFSMSREGEGGDADGGERRGEQRQPKKLTLWEGMQPDVPAICEDLCSGSEEGGDV